MPSGNANECMPEPTGTSSIGARRGERHVLVSPRSYRPSAGFRFPGDKKFAFSIFDDTDVATLQSVRPIYDLLARLGLYSTKSVWPLRHQGDSAFAGSHTLEHREYAAYVRDLAKRGFEIALHGATMESSGRDDTSRALELFKSTLGFYPRGYAGHATNRENLYWGAARFDLPVVRRMYSLLSSEPAQWFQGHEEGSEWFWGDLSLRHLDYVRSFTFDTIDLWSLTPHVCYEDPQRPWVRRWFITADADNVEEFVRLMDEKNQDRLERDGGLCLLSTHLGKGFVADDRVEPRVQRLLERMAQRNGWFAPVSEILDYLSRSGFVRPLPADARRKLELRWLVHAIRRRIRRKRYQKAELQYLSR